MLLSLPPFADVATYNVFPDALTQRLFALHVSPSEQDLQFLLDPEIVGVPQLYPELKQIPRSDESVLGDVVQTPPLHDCPDEQTLLHDAQFDVVPNCVSQPFAKLPSQSL